MAVGTITAIAASAERPLLAATGEVSFPPPSPYLDLELEVPPGTPGLELSLRFDKVVDAFQLYAGLLDPDGVFRGHVQCPGGPGPRDSRIRIGATSATPGSLAGPIPSGRWTVRIDLDRCTRSGRWELDVRSWDGQEPPPADRLDADQLARLAVATPRRYRPAGWLAGELHSHTLHSDGACTPRDQALAAQAAGLDFIAISDHFTTSHWGEVDRLNADPDVTPLVMSAIEVTSHAGHANLHGLSRVPDVYVDRPDWTFADLAEACHRDGGLVTLNHPFSGLQAWHRFDAPLAVADLIEVVNLSQGPNNDAAIGLWDRLLGDGQHLTAVAGTDSHDPRTPEGALGRAVTVVRAEPEPTAVVDALASGECYVDLGGSARLEAVAPDGRRARMGATLSAAGGVRLEVSVSTPEAACAIVFKNGLMWQILDVPITGDAEHVTVLSEPDPITAPYRVELHRRGEGPQFWATVRRSHESLLALSNPVWLDAAPNEFPPPTTQPKGSTQ